ncbi:exodeoxyribonuclease VII small subunit [Dethiosulfovibrio salsuginis]|uniref:Exodeoxyribonuclease 7 small subunit n=1 Tax=Dethiosulfovibrio salsuginis TaxID=561720 RepID=A0A1X7I2Z1_9BACT|nr:exodeoxyribonuclease VII small subunit [Dethiosulfovibrio salsuginis]SMG08820.1 Exodeoxyribonuclease VII small subunit [Dethiosulfovibrio salsuginis]
MGFSLKIAELENILRKLESDAIPLEESFSLFEEGKALIADCRKQLESFERKVTILTEKGEEALEQGNEG